MGVSTLFFMYSIYLVQRLDASFSLVNTQNTERVLLVEANATDYVETTVHCSKNQLLLLRQVTLSPLISTPLFCASYEKEGDR